MKNSMFYELVINKYEPTYSNYALYIAPITLQKIYIITREKIIDYIYSQLNYIIKNCNIYLYIYTDIFY